MTYPESQEWARPSGTTRNPPVPCNALVSSGTTDNLGLPVICGTTKTIEGLRIPWDQPLDADRCEETYPYEVACDGCEGPEEILPKVGFLQGEVLVGLQAGRHLC